MKMDELLELQAILEKARIKAEIRYRKTKAPVDQGYSDGLNQALAQVNLRLDKLNHEIPTYHLQLPINYWKF